MATAFDYYKPTGSQITANPALNNQVNIYPEVQQAKSRMDAANQNFKGGVFGVENFRDIQKLTNDYNQAFSTQQASSGAGNGGAGSGGSPAASRDLALGMTAGVSDRIMNDSQVAAALGQLESGMKSGPYSEAIQQQLVNRNADQTAAMEATNAEQLRNEAAARGIDPSAALRQGQAQRQQSNIAFQGDLGSKAAVSNYEAQQNAARGLASARLSQYGQAQPGYGQASSYLANEQFTSPRTSAVQSNSAPSIAFSSNRGNINGSGSNIPNPNYSTSTLPSYSNTQQSAAFTTPAQTAINKQVSTQPTPGTPDYNRWYNARYGQVKPTQPDQGGFVSRSAFSTNTNQRTTTFDNGY